MGPRTRRRYHRAFAGVSRLDVYLASALVIAVEAQTWLGRQATDTHWAITAIAALVFAATVAVRGTRPGVALLVAVSVVAVQAAFGGALVSGALPTWSSSVAVLVVLSYSVGHQVEGRQGVGLLVAGGLLVALSTRLGPGNAAMSIGDGAESAFYAALVVAPAWFVGQMMNRYESRSAAFREVAAHATADQRLRTSIAVAEERSRIGGELQDIIAHSITGMVVQAGGARLLVRSEPQRASLALLAIEQQGREALGDLRRLLGVLRKDDDSRTLSPQPGLDRIGGLVESVRHGGLECENVIRGDRIALTPGVDLVAYRLIESVLSAARRYGASRGRITIDFAPSALEIQISCDASLPETDAGLEAIGQRVALYDGELQLTADERAGTLIDARLPLDDEVNT